MNDPQLGVTVSIPAVYLCKKGCADSQRHRIPFPSTFESLMRIAKKQFRGQFEPKSVFNEMGARINSMDDVVPGQTLYFSDKDPEDSTPSPVHSPRKTPRKANPMVMSSNSFNRLFGAEPGSDLSKAQVTVLTDEDAEENTFSLAKKNQTEHSERKPFISRHSRINEANEEEESDDDDFTQNTENEDNFDDESHSSKRPQRELRNQPPSVLPQQQKKSLFDGISAGDGELLPLDQNQEEEAEAEEIPYATEEEDQPFDENDQNDNNDDPLEEEDEQDDEDLEQPEDEICSSRHHNHHHHSHRHQVDDSEDHHRRRRKHHRSTVEEQSQPNEEEETLENQQFEEFERLISEGSEKRSLIDIVEELTNLHFAVNVPKVLQRMPYMTNIAALEEDQNISWYSKGMSLFEQNLASFDDSYVGLDYMKKIARDCLVGWNRLSIAITGPAKSGKSTFLSVFAQQILLNLIASERNKKYLVIPIDISLIDEFTILPLTLQCLSWQCPYIRPILPTITKVLLTHSAFPKSFMTDYRQLVPQIEALFNVDPFSQPLHIAKIFGLQTIFIVDNFQLVQPRFKEVMEASNFVAATNDLSVMAPLNEKDVDLLGGLRVLTTTGIVPPPESGKQVTLDLAEGGKFVINEESCGGCPAYIRQFRAMLEDGEEEDGELLMISDSQNIVNALFVCNEGTVTVKGVKVSQK